MLFFLLSWIFVLIDTRIAKEAQLPQPVFADDRGAFTVCLYNREHADMIHGDGTDLTPLLNAESPLLSFCAVPRTRQEIADFLDIRSVQYAMKRYVEPLVASGAIVLSIPDRPRSRKQTYQARASAR